MSLIELAGAEKSYGALREQDTMHFASDARSGKSTGNVLNVDGGVPAAYPRWMTDRMTHTAAARPII
jgi:hypothetical protein